MHTNFFSGRKWSRNKLYIKKSSAEETAAQFAGFQVKFEAVDRQIHFSTFLCKEILFLKFDLFHF